MWLYLETGSSEKRSRCVRPPGGLRTPRDWRPFEKGRSGQGQTRREEAASAQELGLGAERTPRCATLDPPPPDSGRGSSGPGGGRRRRPRRRGASLCGRGASFRPRSRAAAVAVPGRAQGGGTWTCPPSRRGGPRGLVVGRAGGRGRAVAVFPRCRLPQGRTARPSRECRGVRERRGTAASAPRRAPREATPCHALLSQPRSRHRAERPVRVPRREACQASCCSQWGTGLSPPTPQNGETR